MAATQRIRFTEAAWPVVLVTNLTNAAYIVLLRRANDYDLKGEGCSTVTPPIYNANFRVWKLTCGRLEEVFG